MMARILAEGANVSPLFTAPWVRTDIFKMDWLHSADHGITADFAGNLLHMIMRKMPGRNDKLKCQRLWEKRKSFLLFPMHFSHM